jgi:hypothetical protein
MSNCPTCRWSPALGDRFCQQCGTLLPTSLNTAQGVSSATSQPARSFLNCHSCRAINDAGNRFCEGCGNELSPSATSGITPQAAAPPPPPVQTNRHSTAQPRPILRAKKHGKPSDG